MKVVRAGTLGFCMGVRRAVDLAVKAVREAEGRRVYTLGPLIHNPQVLADLSGRGVRVLEEDRLPEDLAGAVVIIRAHGIRFDLEAALASRGARLADATCPKVKASQMKARALSNEGCRVFLAGERNHGEVIGIRGYAPGCIVVANPVEAAAAAEGLFREHPQDETALIGQTTITGEEYQAVCREIRRYFPRLRVIDTICGATRDRQEALRELCLRVDAVIVAGGRESANTRRLLSIARSQGKPAWLVESPGEISGGISDEIAAYPRVGLSAGASTPDSLIEGIVEALGALRPGTQGP
jgi:4-hydroxy-3-methylbut-2-enyl diphosphate reductase